MKKNRRKKWSPPYDPRAVNKTLLVKDTDGNFYEKPECGMLCPGCGICCVEYRGESCTENALVQGGLGGSSGGASGEFLEAEPVDAGVVCAAVGEPCTGMVQGEATRKITVRTSRCGRVCPGYARCCQPEAAEEAGKFSDPGHCREILKPESAANRRQITRALEGLAQAGTEEAMAAIEEYTARVPGKLRFAAVSALEECCLLYVQPADHSEADEFRKVRVMNELLDEVFKAKCEIDEEVIPKMDATRYRLSLTKNLLIKASEGDDWERWNTEIAAYSAMLVWMQGRLNELKDDVRTKTRLMGEIEAQVGVDRVKEIRKKLAREEWVMQRILGRVG